MASVRALVFQTSFALILHNVWTAQHFEGVQQCPKTAMEWASASVRKACQGQATPDYQCAAIEDNVGKFGEICTKKGLSQANKCAVLNSQTYNLDYADCKAPRGCPTSAYPSTEVYKFPICYGNFYGSARSIYTTTDNRTTSTVATSTEKMTRTGTGAIIGMAVCALMVLVIAISCFILYQKRRTVMNMLRQRWNDRLPQCLKDESVEMNAPEMEPLEGNIEKNRDPEKQDGLYLEPIKREPIDPNVIYSKPKKKGEVDSTKRAKEKRLEKDKIKTMNILQKYLVKILKNELDIKDLKEKTIIHHKSLVEHINDFLLEKLSRTESKNDFDNFDISLVLLLLTNFCSNINPPTRGWDFEPSPDDLSVGADIERVRLLWNKICDRDLPEIRHFRDIKDRMETRYGVIHEMSDDEFDEMRIKIQHVTLNPECITEEGVVITKGIKSVLTLLNDFDIVICRGVIGCGKTTLMDCIARTYEKNGWTVRRKNENIAYEDTVVVDSQKILLCCDNFLGSFCFNPLPKQKWLATEKLFDEQSPKASGSFKMLVLIHQHVYDEIPKHVQSRLIQLKNYSMEISRAEMLLIFQQQMKAGHCTQETKCWFSSIDFEKVEAKLKQSTEVIGHPALTLVYTHLHELFSVESFSKSPIQALEQYFSKMRAENSELYYILVYIMFVKWYRLGENLQDWGSNIHTSVTKENIEKNIERIRSFIHRNQNSITIIHEILCIAIFHASFKQDLPLALRFCDYTTLLQIVRPTDQNETYHQLTTVLPKVHKGNKDELGHVIKIIARRISEDEEFYSLIQEHPLINDTYLNSKVKRYCKFNK